MKNYLNPFLQINATKEKGLGVFIIQDIEADTLVEIAPVLVLNKKDTALIHQTFLHDYYFAWGKKQQKSAIALGYVSIYNHSKTPNCYYECHFENNTISIFSKYNIKAGEELLIDYTMGEDKILWFTEK